MILKLKVLLTQIFKSKSFTVAASFIFPYFLYLTIPPKYLLSADHYEKFILGKSIYLSAFQSLDVFYPGFGFDPELKFSLLKMSIVNGHTIIAFPVSLGILYAFTYPFGGVYGIYFLSALLIGAALYGIGKEYKIPAWQIFLFSILSPIVMNGYLFMDVGVGLFLFVFGIFFYQRSKEKQSIPLGLLAGFLSSLSYWFRLEYLIFIGLYWFYEGIISFSEKSKNKRRFFLTSAILILLFLVYCGFNQWFFNSPLGPRYNANYGSVGNSNLFKNFINLLFYGNLKLGLFGYSPFLFLGVLFFVFVLIKNWKDILEKEKPILVSSIVGIFVAAIVAPNDGGAESGSRYLAPGLPGLFVLTSKFFSFIKIKKKIWRIPFYLLLFISIFPTWIYYKTTKGFAKNTKVVQEFILKEPKENLLIFQNGLIGGMAGEDLYFQGRIYQSVGVKELLEFLKKFSVSKNQKSVSFEYFAYSQEYTEGMKDLKYDSDTKEGMIGHLKQFHSKEISDITSVRIVNKKKLGNIEIFYGIYQEK
ncbi:putative membrane protein [Leptospira kirschneri str. JB]|uniref:LA_3751/LA_3752 family putative glycosyltransferase n=1 Tax=Leptospira kirschneri TaxID=29507 RepID=UPI0002BED6AB|nr:membrane protein [Leptospira kirschneri]EMJ91754.1 putative membrane protein [Leptospira kirschneri str. JB]